MGRSLIDRSPVVISILFNCRYSIKHLVYGRSLKIPDLLNVGRACPRWNAEADDESYEPMLFIFVSSHLESIDTLGLYLKDSA